jgi:hypothetical protein
VWVWDKMYTHMRVRVRVVGKILGHGCGFGYALPAPNGGGCHRDSKMLAGLFLCIHCIYKIHPHYGTFNVCKLKAGATTMTQIFLCIAFQMYGHIITHSSMSLHLSSLFPQSTSILC